MPPEPQIRVRKRGFLSWEAEVLTGPLGDFGAWGQGLTRRGAIKDAKRKWKIRQTPWEKE
jgi:hypothetical protein